MGVELASYVIRVNLIAITFIDTPITRPFFEDKAFKKGRTGALLRVSVEGRAS